MTAPSTTEEFSGLRDRLVAVETKIDIVLARLGDGHTDHEARLRALEARPDNSRELAEHAADLAQVTNRVATLEKWRWLITGAAAAGGGTLGAFFASLMGAG